MATLSIFIDESGAGNSRYYLLSLVFHDQAESLEKPLGGYLRSAHARGLEGTPFHASPLLNGHGGYENMGMEQRKRHLFAFFALFQRLPISYWTFAYNKSEFLSDPQLSARMRRDVSNLVFDHLAWFQSFDEIEVFYDGGQKLVSAAIWDAFDFALSREAVVRRESDPKRYVLAQAADFACTIELTALKYGMGRETATDRRFFGSGRDFRRNVLRLVRRKRLDG